MTKIELTSRGILEAVVKFDGDAFDVVRQILAVESAKEHGPFMSVVFRCGFLFLVGEWTCNTPVNNGPVDCHSLTMHYKLIKGGLWRRAGGRGVL